MAADADTQPLRASVSEFNLVQQVEPQDEATPQAKVTLQTDCLVVRQLRPPQLLDKTQYGEYIDEHGIMRPVTGDVAVVTYTAKDLATGQVLEQVDASHPKFLLLGDPQLPLGLGVALAQLALGEKADVAVSDKLMRTHADQDGRTRTVPVNEAGMPSAAGQAQQCHTGVPQQPPAGSQPPQAEVEPTTQPAEGSVDRGDAQDPQSLAAGEGIVYEGMEVLAIVPGHGSHAAKPITSDAAKQQPGSGGFPSPRQIKHQAASRAAGASDAALMPKKPRNWLRRHCSIDFMAPWKALKACGSFLGVRDLAVFHRHKEKPHQDVKPPTMHTDAGGLQPGSAAVLTAR